MNIKPIAGSCMLLISLIAFIACTVSEPVTNLEPSTEPVTTTEAEPEPITTTQAATEQTTTAEPETQPLTIVITPTEEPTEEPERLDPVEIELIGRTIWGEADGVKSKAERAAVAWCILNRVDAYGKTIEEVVTAPKQFQGYRPKGECPQRCLDLAADVLARWYAEKDGAEDVGRVLPAEYLYFMGDGKRNHFSIKFLSTDYWDWSLPDPYITGEHTAGE